MYKISTRFSVLTIFLFTYTFVFSPLVLATEIIISENGTGSSSTATIENTTQTNVNQTNEATIDNNADIWANTGNNQASGNTNGGVFVETGDANTNAEVSNSLNNSSVSTGACCAGEDQVWITRNGSESENTVNLNTSMNFDINVYQNAKITNNITGYVNTGKNKANDNEGGGVVIETGDINVSTKISNDSVITADVNVLGESRGGVDVNIARNGEGSTNKVNLNFPFNNSVNISNNSKITNYSEWYLNTGENEASGNTDGNIRIKTGDINLDIFIENFTNLSSVDINDCCKLDDPKQEVDPDLSDDPEGEGGKFGGAEESRGGLPAGAEAEAGGPGILGLSDTSSSAAQALFFWVGLTLTAVGGRIITDELSKKVPSSK